MAVRAKISHLIDAMVPGIVLEAIEVPNEPRKMSSRAGGFMIEAGLPPSMIMAPKMAPNPRTTPMIVAGSTGHTSR